MADANATEAQIDTLIGVMVVDTVLEARTTWRSVYFIYTS